MVVECRKENGVNHLSEIAMRKALKIVLWSLGSLVGLLLLVFGLSLWLLTPDRLTPIVNRYASEYLLADVRFERIDVSLWEHFPLVSIELVEGSVVSKALVGRADTLLAFTKLGVGIDLWGLVDGRGVVVRRVSLDGARAHAVVDTSGVASWAIVRPSTEVETTSSEPLLFSVSSIDLTGGLVADLIDLSDSTRLEASLDALHFKGTLGSSELQIKHLLGTKIKALVSVPSTRSESRVELPLLTLDRRGDKATNKWDYKLNIGALLWAKREGQVLAEALPISVAGAVVTELVDTVRTRFTFEHFEVSAGPVALHIDGRAELDHQKKSIASDLSLGIGPMVVDGLIGVVPPQWRGALAKVRSNIGVTFKARIQGDYTLGSSLLPHITASIDAPSGYLHYQGTKASVDRFVLHAKAIYNPDTLSRSRIELQQLHLDGSGLKLNAHGSIGDFTGDPLLFGSVDGSIDLGRLSREFPSTKGITASGIVSIKGKCDARLSNLHLAGLAHTTLSAVLQFDQVHLNSPLDSLDVTGSGRLSLGANRNVRDTTLQQGLPVLRARLVLDTLKVELGRTTHIKGSQLSVGARMAAAAYEKRPPKGVRKVYPVRGTISGKRLTLFSSVDSSIFRLSGPTIDFRISPSPQAAHIPYMELNIGARSASSRVRSSYLGLVKLNFSVASTIISKKQDSTERAVQMAERLARRYPQIPAAQRLQYAKMMGSMGLGKKDDLSSGDLDLKLDDTWLSLLRRWRSNGRLQASAIRVVSPYMPLRTSLRNINFTFDNDHIELERARLQIGRSDIEVKGGVSNLRQALAGRGNIVMRLAVTGDTLDINQLIVASNAGAQAAARIESQIGAQTTQEQVEEMIQQQVDTANVSQLVIIPKNIDLKASLGIKRGYYGDVVMDSLRTELVARNRILQINKLQARTSIGAMAFNAVYATRSKTDITTGFDVTLTGVDVAQLIHLIPAVDSMLPMLASFRGQLDCSFAATASLDSTMSVLIPSLNAAGSLSGKDLVLLDGQTFTEISKILKFKNRARNLVDRISVELLVRNSAVELFPFVLEMDRYKAAVSGIQRLDMSFDYHISVLKSIIPFRVGVDIYGNMDHWDWKLVGARYKSDKVPSYSALIDTTRVDLRRAITDIFATGLRGLTLNKQAQEVVVHVDSASMAVVDSLGTARIEGR